METLDSRLQKRMHVSLYALLFLTVLLGISILLEGCTDQCEVKKTYTYFEPVYTSFEELQANTGIVAPQPIQTVGKIYLKGDNIFINDPGKGIHIIDNTNPSSPLQLKFLSIPGNYSMAVNNNILYADSFIDLVAFDISDISQIHEVSRIPNVFDYFNTDIGFVMDRTRGLVTGWEEKKNVEVSDSDCNFNSYGPVYCYDGGVMASDAMKFNASLALTPGTGSGPGVGGSMATFTITNNHLYSLSGGYVKPFDISNETAPVLETPVFIAFDAETIFPNGNTLFFGSATGMHIYDITSPSEPLKISTYEHIRTCDPVVVQGDYAYVTLRSGTECAGFTNQLEVINIENLASPRLLKVYPMANPHGLGIDQNTLFVCDGDAGLKVFDAKDVMDIDKNKLAEYKGINAYDVIPFNNILIMIGQDGLYQYDYTNPKDIKVLSHIAANN
jgi:hypothetical protein